MPEHEALDLTKQTLEMHTVLMSVGFGVALAFFAMAVVTLRHLLEWVTAGLTLLVIVCVWWWYAHLGAIFPSRYLHDYLLDYLTAISLCIMSRGISTAVHWVAGWTALGIWVLLKLSLCYAKPIPAGAPDGTHTALVVATVAVAVVLALALYGLRLVLKADDADLGSWKLWIWLYPPVVLGIACSFAVAYTFLAT